MRKKVLIVGDIIVDKYWSGDSHRISPEAPVPIVKISSVEDRLGGAANVANNIAHLRGDCLIIGIVGDDPDGRNVMNLFEKNSILSSLVVSADSPTITKLRISSRNQQMIRCDFEETPSVSDINRITSLFADNIDSCDLVILSDYGKGALHNVDELIKIALDKGKEIFIDPKGEDYFKYRGATAITPNKSELRAIVGNWNSEDELIEKAQSLRKELNIKYLLLTRSEEGMTIFSDNGEINISAQAKEVFDVSGAGDTAIAVLGMAYLNETSFESAVRLANKAAGIVVGKFGTSVIEYSEVFDTNG